MKINILLSLLLTLLMCSCSDEKDEPVNRENPVREAPLLASYHQKFGNCEMWPNEVIDDSELTGKGGDYYYWNAHKAEAQTMEELMALCDVPKDLLSAMSTRNLALTCFMHPYNTTPLFYNSIYQSVFIMTLANSYEEIMRRRSGAAELLNLYCELEYPKSRTEKPTAGLSYEDYKTSASESYAHLNGLSLFLMTAVDYNALNKEQLARLSSEIFRKIDNIAAADEEMHYEGYRYTYLIGAFIAYHYDNKLSENEVNLLRTFIASQGVPSNEYYSRATAVISQSLERMQQVAQ